MKSNSVRDLVRDLIHHILSNHQKSWRSGQSIWLMKEVDPNPLLHYQRYVGVFLSHHRQKREVHLHITHRGKRQAPDDTVCVFYLYHGPLIDGERLIEWRPKETLETVVTPWVERNAETLMYLRQLSKDSAGE